MYLPKTCCLRNLRPASRRARRIDHTRCSAEFWFARSFLARRVISGSRRMSPCSREADARDNGLNRLLPHVPHPDPLPWWGEGVEVAAPHPDPTLDTRKAVLQITQHVIEEAARTGNVVIVGRGGAYILRSFPDALHVFLRAAEAVRVKTIMARFNIGSEDAARRRLKQTDENWTSYIRQVYGHDRNHPAHYDMVLDTGRLGYEATVDAILEALKRRKPIT